MKTEYIKYHLTGQYILLDFNTDVLLPIYVMNDEYIRVQSRFVHIHDLKMFVQTELENGDFIDKNNCQLEHTYIELSNQADLSDQSDDAVSNLQFFFFNFST